jgi:hypothetical protein
MTKNIVLTLMLIGLAVSLFATTKLLVYGTEPKFRITYEVINPKFVPDNFTCSTFDELMNHHFQIPVTLLKELTNEELMRYILSTTEFMLNPYYPSLHSDISGFNGYTELISRTDWASDIIQLPQKFLDEGDHVMLLHTLRFITMRGVFTKMTLQEQQQVLMYLKELLLIQRLSPEFETVGLISGEISYLSASVVGFYYQSDIERIMEGGPVPHFKSGVENSRSLVLAELQNAIDSGMRIEVDNENKN